MTDKIIDRLRKLLSMTTAKGCSEDEQETALRIAANLAAKNGIELASIQSKDTPKPKAIKKAAAQGLKIHQMLVAQAAATLVGVEPLTYEWKNEYQVEFVGRPELVELAEELMFFLFRQVESLYKESLPKGLSQRERAEYRKTFKAACAHRTLARAREYMADLKRSDSTAQASTGSTALVVRGYFDSLKDEIKEYWEETFYAPARARAEKAKERDQQYLASLSEEDRAAELKRRDKEAKKNAKRYAKMKPRRGKSLPTGSGTQAGLSAGNRVKLRTEID